MRSYRSIRRMPCGPDETWKRFPWRIFLAWIGVTGAWFAFTTGVVEIRLHS
ncbi:MAG: hypothetical protein LW695_04775 [Phenylobacterium sp.]|nr:hypothetical protein [Phenylobacterium sp.]MCE2819542.1 hypothetical protein [Phenylobacterium sp.]